MRGKVTGLDSVLANFGITPAYAGKRLLFSRAELAAEDHPRLCGEKRAFSGLNCVELGSPPPMRGKVTRTVGNGLQHRITPAYAGKSHCFFIVAGDDGDHPRLCGEKRGNRMLARQAGGSPPPMRGKALLVYHKSFDDRITPAYAGKS